MSAAQKYLPHYTVADYQSWEGDWELWQGIPVSMSPSPFGPHQRIAKNLVFELESQVRKQDCQSSVLFEIDWIIADDTVVRPDVIVLCGDPPLEHVQDVPALVAEVQSGSTAQRDRTAKRDLYNEQGVAVYLLIDPEQQSVEAYRREQSTGWDHEVVTDEIEFTICGDCRFRLDLQSLFR